MDDDTNGLTPAPPPEAKPEQVEAAEDPGSRETIDVEDRDDLDRWATALGTTDSALAAAVQHVGSRLDRVKDFLGQGGIASVQEDG
jgi:hypothetical protein